MIKPEPDSSSGRPFLPAGLGRAGLTVSMDTTAGQTLRAMASKRSPSGPTSEVAAGAGGLAGVCCWAETGEVRYGDSDTAAEPPAKAQAPRKDNRAKRFITHLPQTWLTYRKDLARGRGSEPRREGQAGPARADAQF